MRIIHVIVSLTLMVVSCTELKSQDVEAMCRHYDSLKGTEIPRITTIGKKYIIYIRSNDEFQCLNELLLKAINCGEKNIDIRFKPGTFFFRQNHIELRGLDLPETSISIEGKGSTIIPEGPDYLKVNVENGMVNCSYQGAMSPETLFITKDGEIVDVWTPIRQSGEKIVISSNSAFLNSKLYGEIMKNACIRIPSWYYSRQYPIENKSEEGIITFIPDTDKGFKKDYKGDIVLNYDKEIAKQPIRYQCFNIENDEVPYSDGENLYFPSKYNELHDCLSSQLIHITSTTLKQLSITGLNCLGGKGGGDYIYFSKVKAERICITNCKFKGIKSTLMSIKQTDNVQFTNNQVEQCFSNGIFSYNGSRKTIVTKCTFDRNGLGLTQTRCVYCGGEDFYVADNTFKDFANAAVAAGVNYNKPRQGKVCGIIENNEIYYTPEYFNNYWKYTLADGGAIYVSSQNDQVIIRYNYIHDYRGINGNRGIMGDDGAKNLTVYGNVIKNVPNYYAIDIYRAKHADNDMPDANTHNYVFCNLIDGAYRLGGKDDTTCSDGGNVIVFNSYNRYNKPLVSNSRRITKNVSVHNTQTQKQKEQLKCSLPPYQKIKKYL